jgi:RNA recognition motif-containing protein
MYRATVWQVFGARDEHSICQRGPAFLKRAQGGLMQRRLFIGNLTWGVTDADLSDLVSEHAQVIDSKVITDRDTGRSRGFGFVTVETDNVQDLIRKLDGQDLDGRPIRVNEAEEKPQRDRGSFGGGSRRRGRY